MTNPSKDNRLSFLYQKISQLGLSEGQSDIDIQLLKLINTVALSTNITAVLLILQAIWAGDFYAVLIGFVLISINSLPLYFHYHHKNQLATWVFCLYSPPSLALMIMAFGRDVSTEYSFMIFTIHLIIFLRKPFERLFYSIYVAAMIAATYYYTTNFTSPLARDFNFFERNALFFTVLIFVIIVLKKYVDLTDKSLHKVNDLLNEQKKINEALKAQQKTIEQQNNELQLANEELEKFAYIASHDLKSPLRNVNGFLTLIERKIKQGRTDIVEDIQYATRASTQMYHLIEDILRFSRMKQQEMSFQKVLINDLVMQVMLNLEKTIKEKSVEVIVELLPDIECNRSQMSLLFQNLLENAMKYNDNPKPIIEIYSQQIGEKVLISVKDNGIGIPMDYQDKVFEMFARLHNQEVYEGTGLGLAICKRIVTAHQGDIWFKSDEEDGTIFYIQLPVKQS